MKHSFSSPPHPPISLTGTVIQIQSREDLETVPADAVIEAPLSLLREVGLDIPDADDTWEDVLAAECHG